MRRNNLARFTSVVAVAGIMLGVAALIVALALTNGFQREMRDKILGSTAHISIAPAAADFTGWNEMRDELLQTDYIKTVEPAAYKNVLVGGSKSITYGFLKVDHQSNFARADAGSKASQNTIKVAVGAELAARLDAAPGSELDIVIIEDGSEIKRSTVAVGEIFQTGLFEYDSSWVRISPEDFARLIGREKFQPTALSLFVEDIYQSGETAETLRSKYGSGYRIIDWQEANRPLFAALSLEKKVSAAIISLVILIAALNITTTLALLVNERRLDIAVLRTCGAKSRSIIAVFASEGLFMGLSGTLLGIVLGLAACAAGNRFRIIDIPAEVYSLSYIPLLPTMADVSLIAAGALVLSLLAALYPAFKASRVKPLEIIRRL